MYVSPGDSTRNPQSGWLKASVEQVMGSMANARLGELAIASPVLTTRAVKALSIPMAMVRPVLGFRREARQLPSWSGCKRI